MYPEIHLFTAHIGTYGLMACLGALAAIFMASWLERRRGYVPFGFLSSVPWILVFALLGASLLYGLVNIDYIVQVAARAGSYADAVAFLGDLAYAFGGMVFYGGMLGALLGYSVWLRRSGKPHADYMDMFAVALPLFHAFARVGCFLGGCCFGVECPVGFVYTHDPIAMANGVTRFPVQLLEAACEAGLFALLLVLYRRDALRGQLIWVWTGSYGCVRFLDEFLRGDFYRGFWGPLSTSQWISLALICVTVLHVAMRLRRSRQLA